jgi:hypothetical protein
MKVKDLKKIIKESIGDRIKNIDSAGNIASIRAKLEQVKQEIESCHQIKQSYSSIPNIEHYLDSKLIKQCTISLEKSIAELEKTKTKIEGDLNKAENGRVPKKTTSKEDTGENSTKDKEVVDKIAA